MDSNRESNRYQKNLKEDDGSPLEASREAINVNNELNNGLIENDIIDVVGLASLMKQKLNPVAIAQNKEVHFTSAEFAYQMVNSPVKREITITLNVS